MICDRCVYDVKGCCDYDEPLGAYCVNGSAFKEKPMEQMSIFDFIPDPNIKYDAMHIKWQEKKTNRRGVETLYVTEKTWYDTLKKWRAENKDKYYFLGVEWD